VKVVAVRATLAAPEMDPFEESERPAGSVGLTVRESVPSPPEAVTGVKGADAWPCVTAVAEITVVAVIDESTVKLKAAVAVAPS
jgi:hypothetical protein